MIVVRCGDVARYASFFLHRFLFSSWSSTFLFVKLILRSLREFMPEAAMFADVANLKDKVRMYNAWARRCRDATRAAGDSPLGFADGELAKLLADWVRDC